MIPKLLKKGIGDERALHSSPNHPLRVIHDWVTSAKPGTGDVIARRQALWQCLRKWFSDGGDQATGLRALSSVVSPGYGEMRQNPRDSNSFMFVRGAVNVDELKQIAELWPDILRCLEGMQIVEWQALMQAIDKSIYSVRVGGHLGPECQEVLDKTNRMVLPRIAEMAVGRPGVLSGIKVRSGYAGVAVSVVVDSDFARLFPQDPFDGGGDWRVRAQEQALAANQLAGEWVKLEAMRVFQETRLVHSRVEDTGAAVPRLFGDSLRDYGREPFSVYWLAGCCS